MDDDLVAAAQRLTGTTDTATLVQETVLVACMRARSFRGRGVGVHSERGPAGR